MLQSSQAYPNRREFWAGGKDSAQRLSRQSAAPAAPDAAHLFVELPDRPGFRPPVVQSLREMRGRPLARLLLVLAATVAVVVLAASSIPMRPLEATVQMERPAVKMERARILAPETIDAVARLMSRPSYDCRQVPCRLELQQRNQAARDRLHAVFLGAHPPIHDASAAQSGAHAIQSEGF